MDERLNFWYSRGIIWKNPLHEFKFHKWIKMQLWWMIIRPLIDIFYPVKSYANTMSHDEYVRSSAALIADMCLTFPQPHISKVQKKSSIAMHYQLIRDVHNYELLNGVRFKTIAAMELQMFIYTNMPLSVMINITITGIRKTGKCI